VGAEGPHSISLSFEWWAVGPHLPLSDSSKARTLFHRSLSEPRPAAHTFFWVIPTTPTPKWRWFHRVRCGQTTQKKERKKNKTTIIQKKKSHFLNLTYTYITSKPHSCVQGPLRECRSIRSGVRGPSRYCAPLVQRDNVVYWKTNGKINNDLHCAPLVYIPDVIGVLAVWRHNNKKQKTKKIFSSQVRLQRLGGWVELIDWCCFYYFVRNSLVALLEALCARISSLDSWISVFPEFFLLCVCARSLTKPFFRPSQPGSCAWLSTFLLCADCTCVLVCVCLCMCMRKCVGKVIKF